MIWLAVVGIPAALVLIAVVVPQLAERRQRCPHCSSAIPAIATVCRRCGRDVTASA